MRYALIADPDEVQAALYAAIVREEELMPFIVRDGSAAVAALLERGTPALLITELALPQLNGFEIIERLRRAAAGAKTPVIVVSANRDQRDAATTRRARLGISAILSKVASDDSLKRVVKKLLGAGGRVAAAGPKKASPAAKPDVESAEPSAPRDSGVVATDEEPAASRAAPRRSAR